MEEWIAPVLENFVSQGETSVVILAAMGTNRGGDLGEGESRSEASKDEANKELGPRI